MEQSNRMQMEAALRRVLAAQGLCGDIFAENMGQIKVMPAEN